MRKSIVVLIALIAAVTIGSPAAEATKYCAPLPVASSGLTSCKCAVHNYSTVTDTGIHVTIYQGSGVANTCALTLAPKHGDYCHVAVAINSTCGCVVTGESALTYASLSLMETVNSNVVTTSVPCQ